MLAWVKDLIDQIIAQEFDAADLEFVFSAEPSIDPQAQEAILSSYTSKGIITINEARAALGRDPYPDAAANKPMTLTGGGYVALGQAAQASPVAKFNSHHDERGRFATADGVASASPHAANNRQLAFTGTLIDKRYDEVIDITHCTYATPTGTFTIEVRGHIACPDTYPAPDLGHR